MKVVQINSTCGVGSTGKICVSISEMLTKENIENYILYSSEKSDYPLGYKCANKPYIKFQALKSRVFGNNGFNSKKITKKTISFLKKIQPDIVHLHNLHSHNINLTQLFSFLKKENIRVVWTMHDCWAFTGYCPHFAFIACNQWIRECISCPQYKTTSWFFDRSRNVYRRKKAAETGVKNLTIVTPSQWLADLVKQSFLKDYPIKVIHNGIDLTVFKPTPSDFRKKYGIPENKFILLGVAFGWGARKGLDVFIELAHRLDKEKFQIVLVGTDNNADKQLPKEIISIHRTQNQAELAEIYTAADLFVNPTREEVLGLVNIEANACGTPVVTFRTGGSPECICEKTGSVTGYNDIDALQKEIERICETEPFSKEDCIMRAKEFDENVRFKEYLELYRGI